MAKRKTLPKDFEQLVQTASDEDIKKVLGKCDINAYGGYNKGKCTGISTFRGDDAVADRAGGSTSTMLTSMATHRCFIMLEECHQRNRQ